MVVGPIVDLPPARTPFVGRAREAAAIRAALLDPAVRLITLTGPAGAGKTRLAIQVASELRTRFRDGVCFVGLAPIGDPSLVAPAIAQALGSAGAPGRPPLEAAQRRLRDLELLLLIDNFEQVLAAAPLVGQLLADAPGLSVLATSRAALRVYGEHELAVPPLSLPDPARRADLDAVRDSEAVALLVERARAVQSGFELTPANAASLAEICLRLDGLPLAIELAAARLRLLAPTELLIRLRDRLALLVGGPRDAPARHQTLRAAIDWSFGLLGPGEQALLLRLAVFQGGCRLEAAEAVCAGRLEGLEVLDGLASLADKSLLGQRDDPDGQPRFEPLETIRAYALERLDGRADAADARARHAEHVLGLAEGGELARPLSAREEWLVRLEWDHDNLRAALDWSLARGHRPDLGVRLAAALGRFWELRSHLSEAHGWLDLALARDGTPPHLRARLLTGAGNVARARGDRAAGRRFHERALRLYRRLDDRSAVATSLNDLGVLALEDGDLASATALHGESLAIQRARGDRWAIARSLNNLGLVAVERGELTMARSVFEESLTLFRREGDRRGIAYAVNNLSAVARDQGRAEEALRLCADGLRLRRELADRWAVVFSLLSLADLVGARGDVVRATRLFGAADAIRQSIDAHLPPATEARAHRLLASARARLDDQTFLSALARGRELTLDEAVDEALGAAEAAVATTAASPGGVGDQLSRREREVAALVAAGLTDRLIAERLVIGRRTAETHVANILAKLGLGSRAAIAAWATARGLVGPVAPP